MTETNFDSMRRAMVSNQLRTWAVSDPQVVAAMSAVAREVFVPSERAAVAYADALVPMGKERTLNTPMVTGRLLTALEVRPGDKLLLIGAATGYAAALVAQMGASVIALEEDERLLDTARKTVGDNARVTLVQGPLAAGWKKGAPYDAILIDGAIEHLPDAIKAQLADGGRIAAGLVERGVTRLATGRKAGDALALVDFADAETALLPGFVIPRGFVF